MFAAIHHVMFDGHHYLPGEVIDRPVPEETARWWLSVGAVVQVHDGPESGTIQPSGDEPDKIDPPEDPEDEPDGRQNPQNPFDVPEEIDVSAGVIPASEPKKSPRARKNGGK